MSLIAGTPRKMNAADTGDVHFGAHTTHLEDSISFLQDMMLWRTLTVSATSAFWKLT